MATQIWRGDGGTNLASTNACWLSGSAPGTGDDCVFSSVTTENCFWDLAQVKSIDTSAMTHAGANITFNNNVTLTGLNNGCILKGTSKTIFFAGTAQYSPLYIKLASGHSFLDITQFTFSIDASSAGATVLFDAGIYPLMVLTGGTFSPQYIAPTLSTNTTVQMQGLTVNNGVTFAHPAAAPTTNDRARIWEMMTSTNLTCAATSFGGGFGKWIFLGISGGYPLPTTGNTANFGTSNTFTSSFEHIEIKVATAGHYGKLHSGARLVLNDLTVQVGAALIGPSTGGAVILCVNRPTIKGTWGFRQIADGIYADPRDSFLVGVPFGGTGVSSITANRIPIGNGMTALASSANFTFDTSTTTATAGLLNLSGNIIKTTVVNNAASPYTVLVTDYIILCDTSTGAITINLPSIASQNGREYLILDMDGQAGANNITVARNGSDTIGFTGATSMTLNEPVQHLRLVSNGTNWVIVSMESLA